MLRSFRLVLIAGAVSASALLYVACGEKSSEPEGTPVATQNADMPVTANTIAALYTAPTTFSAGIPALGTSAATTLAFTQNPADSSKPLFSVKSGTDSASGTMAFGSCHFIINAKTSGITTISIGDTVIVDPCKVGLSTSGQSVGVSQQTNASLQLGTTVSQVATLLVNITTTGVVQIVTPSGVVIIGTTVPVAKPSGAQ